MKGKSEICARLAASAVLPPPWQPENEQIISKLDPINEALKYGQNCDKRLWFQSHWVLKFSPSKRTLTGEINSPCLVWFKSNLQSSKTFWTGVPHMTIPTKRKHIMKNWSVK